MKTAPTAFGLRVLVPGRHPIDMDNRSVRIDGRDYSLDVIIEALERLIAEGEVIQEAEA